MITSVENICLEIYSKIQFKNLGNLFVLLVIFEENIKLFVKNFFS
jgi:hypothetical protein